jgi:hypothetical protein
MVLAQLRLHETQDVRVFMRDGVVDDMIELMTRAGSSPALAQA